MKYKLLFTIIVLICLQSCYAQHKENSTYIGKGYGEFDLEKITFNENMDTLFSKVKYFEQINRFDYVTEGEMLKQVSEQEYETDKSGKVKRDTLGYIRHLSRIDSCAAIFNEFSITNSNMIEFYLNRKKELVLIENFTPAKQTDAEKFMRKMKEKYKENEILKNSHYDKIDAARKNFNDLFIYKLDNKIVQIEIKNFEGEPYKGKCLVFYKIFKYPNKDKVFLYIQDNLKIFNHLPK